MRVPGRILAVALVYIACLLGRYVTLQGRTGDKRRALRGAAGTAVLACALTLGAVLLFSSLFLLNLVPSASMEDTIRAGDVILSTRYHTARPDRYDVVVFRSPEDGDRLCVKRVIGLPGETILIREGAVYANGVRLRDDFLPEEMDWGEEETYQVPEDCYLLLGDNRNHSLDARSWVTPWVSREDILARVRLVVYPFRDAGWVEDARLERGG